MAIYHLEAKVISRGTGRSACAASAYMSCSAIYNDYDGIQHDYTRKQGLVWDHVFLPDCAPVEWQDREKLWNAVEEAEKTKDSRLAREFVAALPIELGKDEWVDLLSKFIRKQFVDEGMCADVAIHDTDGHNPHAHIMLTVRPLNENGTWQNKTEKEYLCVKGGEERGFTAAEYKEAQKYGWEKQYQYKVGKKKEYLPPSVAEARGLERVSKYPKSTKYGRQNPISERWNSEEQLVKWRAAWADEVNRCLERKGLEERIDHRSFADQGKDEQPTIHEGVAARMMEKKGIVSDRCEVNRQIKRDNALLRRLKDEVQKLVRAVQESLPAMAMALETLRANMIVLAYQVLHAKDREQNYTEDINMDTAFIQKYDKLNTQISKKRKELKALNDKKAKTSIFQPLEHIRLNDKIDEVREVLKELRTEKANHLDERYLDNDAGVQRIRDKNEERMQLRQEEQIIQARSKLQLDFATEDYRDLETEASRFDPDELMEARLEIRPKEEQRAVTEIKQNYGKMYDSSLVKKAKTDVAERLGEAHVREKPRSVRDNLRQLQQEIQQRELTQKRKKSMDWER